MTQPPLPQPHLEPTGITFEQYDTYTLQKLELWNGFYNYGGQDLKGFHLAVLTNMGLRSPANTMARGNSSDRLQNPQLNFDTAAGEAMLNRLNRGLEDLKAVAE
jgi:hypothetical protein